MIQLMRASILREASRHSTITFQCLIEKTLQEINPSHCIGGGNWKHVLLTFELYRVWKMLHVNSKCGNLRANVIDSLISKIRQMFLQFGLLFFLLNLVWVLGICSVSAKVLLFWWKQPWMNEHQYPSPSQNIKGGCKRDFYLLPEKEKRN